MIGSRRRGRHWPWVRATVAGQVLLGLALFTGCSERAKPTAARVGSRTSQPATGFTMKPAAGTAARRTGRAPDPYQVAGMDCPPTVAPDTVAMVNEISQAYAQACREKEATARRLNQEALRRFQKDEADLAAQAAQLGVPFIPNVPPMPVYPAVLDPDALVASSPRLSALRSEIDRRQAAYELHLQQTNPRGYLKMKERFNQQWAAIRQRNLELAARCRASALTMSALSQAMANRH